MDPVAILSTAWDVFCFVKKLVDDNAAASEEWLDLSEMLDVHSVIIKNISTLRSPGIAILAKQYTRAIEKLKLAIESRQTKGKGMFAKLKSFAQSKEFSDTCAALEEKMMKIQVALLSILGTDPTAFPKAADGTVAGPASQSMGGGSSGAPINTAQVVPVLALSAAEQAAQNDPDSDSYVPPPLSQEEIAAIQAAIPKDQASAIQKADVLRRKYVKCADCGKAHKFKRGTTALLRIPFCVTMCFLVTLGVGACCMKCTEPKEHKEVLAGLRYRFVSYKCDTTGRRVEWAYRPGVVEEFLSLPEWMRTKSTKDRRAREEEYERAQFAEAARLQRDPAGPHTKHTRWPWLLADRSLVQGGKLKNHKNGIVYLPGFLPNREPWHQPQGCCPCCITCPCSWTQTMVGENGLMIR